MRRFSRCGVTGGVGVRPDGVGYLPAAGQRAPRETALLPWSRAHGSCSVSPKLLPQPLHCLVSGKGEAGLSATPQLPGHLGPAHMSYPWGELMCRPAWQMIPQDLIFRRLQGAGSNTIAATGAAVNDGWIRIAHSDGIFL
jgi:hypothetical protein